MSRRFPSSANLFVETKAVWRLAAVLLVLSGCTSGNTVLEEDRAVCRSRGLVQGTPAFEACAKKVAEARWREWGRLANLYPPG